MQLVRDFKPQQDHQKLYNQAVWITLGGNFLLAGGKALVAYISGSAAIYSDAANSISDVVYSLLLVLGLYVATRPPDISHPQGHSRFEPLTGLIVTVSMFFASYAAGSNAIQRYLAGGEAIKLDLPTLVLLFSAAIKAVMFVLIRNIGKKLNSPTLKTTAKDNLSDVLTSVAAFIGVVGSTVIHPLADPIAGFLVAIWIFIQAFKAGKENLGLLTGKGASPEEIDEFVKAVQSVPGVIQVHHIMTDYVGPKLIVDIHINVDGNTTLRDSHAISDAVAQKLHEFPQVDRAYVHLEPHDWID
ncbi:MAG: cation diffusion facilitator family transporter [Anaerolineaceae bacterium]